ncbi:MAG: hypothetical protein R3E96_00275 [Planctomycetota bacterium]
MPLLGAGRAVVTQGYIGATEDGLTTTLGRGGSDLSAALFGAALGSSEVQIWTDVEGILTCDPRVVPEAETIPEIGFSSGTRRVRRQGAAPRDDPAGGRSRHSRDRAAHGAARWSFHPHPVLGETPAPRYGPRLARPRNGAHGASTRMLAQSGFLARLFEVFGRLEISVDLIATAEISVSLTIEPGAPIQELVDEISRFADVKVATDRAIVALVGASFRATPGIAGRAFTALGAINVEMISMGANEINLSLVVKMDRAKDALRLLHKEFFEGEHRDTLA